MKKVLFIFNIALTVVLSLIVGACSDFPDDLAYDVNISEEMKIITPKSDIKVSADGKTYGLEVSANIKINYLVNEEIKEAYILARSNYNSWEKKVDVKSQLRSNGGVVTAYIDGIPFDDWIEYVVVVQGNFCYSSCDRISTDYISSDKVGIKTGRAEPQMSYAILHVECNNPQFLDEGGYISIEGFEEQKIQAAKRITDYTFNVCGLHPNGTYRYRAIYIPPVGQPSYGEWHSFTTKDGSSPEAVDLGLSVKWAAWNIGGYGPGNPGIFCSWGETTERYSYSAYYDWDVYKFGHKDAFGNIHYWKYCTNSKYGDVDNKTILDPEDDAAHVNWGGSWRMPTKSEFEELVSNCDIVPANRGVSGLLFRSKKNGNGIFLPAGDSGSSYYFWYDYDKSVLGKSGYYYSSSLDTDGSDDAYGLSFYYPYDRYDNNHNDDYYSLELGGLDRTIGCSVRAVCP